MPDIRKLGQGIRRRIGAPPNHLAMAGKATPVTVGQVKKVAVNPATKSNSPEFAAVQQAKPKERTMNAANMRASVRDQW